MSKSQFTPTHIKSKNSPSKFTSQLSVRSQDPRIGDLATHSKSSDILHDTYPFTI